MQPSPETHSDQAQAVFHDYAPDLEQAQRQSDLPDSHENLSGYIDSMEQLEPAERQAALAQLRGDRRVKDSHVSEYARALDSEIVELIRRGNVDTAQALLTPSRSEVGRMYGAVEQSDVDTTAKEHILEVANKLRHDKQDAIEAIFQTMDGVSDTPELSDLGWVLCEHSSDPESAFTIPADFWRRFPALPDAVQTSFLTTGGNLAVAASSIDALTSLGIQDRAPVLLDRMDTFGDTQQRLDYAKLQSEAIHSLKDQAAAWPGLENFTNPLVAVETARTLYTDEDQQSLDGIRTIFADPEADPRTPIRLEADDVATVVRLKPILDEKDLGSPANLREALDALSGPESSPERTEAVLALMRQLGELPESPQPGASLGILNALKAPEPAESSKLLAETTQRVTDLPPRVQAEFLHAALADPSRAREMVRMVDSLGGRGIVPPFDEEAIALITHPPEEETAQSDRVIDRYMNDRAVGAEIGTILADAIEPGAETAPTARQLDQYPLLADTLARLKVPDEIAESMCTAWTSVNATAIALEHQASAHTADLTPESIAVGAKEKADAMLKQMQAVEDYIEKYGVDELIEIHTIFHTVNFIRAHPEQLHRQLERWKDPTVAPVTIAISSSVSFNQGFSDAGEKAYERFGEDGTFWFEADSKLQLGKSIVAVGRRDSEHGRNPIENPTVQTVLLTGHGAPQAIEIGADLIQVADYVHLADQQALLRSERRSRVQTYEKYIGSTFRLVLQACRAAEDPANGGKNIAEQIHESHDTTVHGSPYSIYDYTILPDGSVEYTTDEPGGRVVPAQVYQ